MLMTLANTFMTASRMDAFAHAGAPAPARHRASGHGLARRALASLRRLLG